MHRGYIRSLLLSVLLIRASAWAAEAPIPAKSASELGRLEQALIQAQEARDREQLQPERYREFLVQFRASLKQAWNVARHPPPDTATYARIQVRLGDSVQALAALRPALEQDPKDADLRLTLGEVNFERKDYPAALAVANAILAKDPANSRALVLMNFSKGRISGASTNSRASTQSGPMEGGSIWNDSKTLEAGRFATGRMNAVHFMDQAMGRLKIGDPHEALRFLALAEVSDPASPDVPMQQGLAYMGLKDPLKAAGRFAEAEKKWLAKGDKQAELARTMRESAAAELAAKPSSAAPEVRPVENPKRTTWPLGGAAAGFLLAGAVALLLKKDEIDRWGRAVNTGAIIGTGVLAGGVLGYAAYALTVTGGGTLALAGGGTVVTAATSEGAFVATAVGGLAGGAARAQAAGGMPEGQPRRETSPGGAPGQGPGSGPIPMPLPIPNGSDILPKDCTLKPNEDILARFIDGTRLSAGFLDKHEAAGGHTIERHVKKGQPYLVRRIRVERKLEASSFYDQATAEEITRQNVTNRGSAIRSWYLAPTTDDHESYFPGSHEHPIGYSVVASNESSMLPKYGALTLLRKSGCQILIVTSHPE